MTGINPDKYKLTSRKGPDISPTERLHPSGTFFPLIKGDALAVMTLRSYANNCLQILDWDIDPVTKEPLTRAQRNHLEQLGQDAMDLAEKWANDPNHLPD